MRIGFFLRDLKVEGVQVVTLRLAEALALMGHRCELITLNGDQELLIPNNVIHHNMGLDQVISYRDASKYVKPFKLYLNKIEKDDPFRAIFSVHGETNDIISFIDSERLIHCIHNSDEYSYNNKSWFKKLKFRRRLERKINGKHIVCVSHGIKDFIEKHINSKYLSISTIYNPFNIDSIINLSMDESIYPLPKEYMVFVGRLEKQKNIILLLETIAKLKSNISLVIIGQGKLKHEIIANAKKLNIIDRIIIYPFCQNPYPIIKKAKLLILTSIYEGLPTVLIEALILGTHVLSTNCPTGPSEILVNHLNKYLIDSYDAEKIAEKVDQILLDKSIIDSSDIRKTFCSEFIGKQYISFIKEKGL
ncbi:TPA: glycosyltransferase [Photobacterium damselae]|uniref:glycosyltransferase n=1 Tax=Photobacterium damselae TaxID=38293 RepID=UPI001EDD36BD|nr:glycosyltransferase [Photobacterium damselae]MCG3825264.1 glycosyltransferase [Photobacterium damselae]